MGGEAPSGFWLEAWVCLEGFRGEEEGPLQPHPSPSYPHPGAPSSLTFAHPLLLHLFSITCALGPPQGLCAP